MALSRRLAAILLLMLMQWALGCTANRPQDINCADNLVVNQESPITHWMVSQPFFFDGHELAPNSASAKNAGLNHDFLAEERCPEDKLSAQTALLSIDCRTLFRPYHSAGTVIPFDKLYPHTVYSVVYAIASIYSKTDQQVGLDIGSSDGTKVWLNGTLIIATSNMIRRAAFKDTHLLSVHLNKGLNTLLIKVDHKEDEWALICSFLSSDELHMRQLHQLDGHLIDNRFIATNEPLIITRPLSSIQLSHINIKRLNGGVISYKVKCSGKDLTVVFDRDTRGFFELALTSDGEVLRDEFYIGDPSHIYKMLRRKEATSTEKNDEFYSRDAVMRRYSVLRSAQYEKPGDSDWQKKLLSVLRQGEELISFSPHSHWKMLPGEHLREFVSKIDSVPQFYFFYVPPHLAPPFPTVLVLPYAEAPVRPFLEGSLISYADDLQDMERAAAENGFAVAIVNGRGTVGPAPIGEADVLETLENLKRNYPIDSSRIYLYGVCEGGWRALALAEHHPTLFAALGTYGPLLNPYHKVQVMQSWQINTDVGASVTNLIHVPLLIERGEYDDRTPLGQLQTFQQALLREGGVTTFSLLKDGLHKEKNLEASIFPFFKGRVRVLKPNTIKVVTYGAASSRMYWLGARASNQYDNQHPMYVEAHLEHDRLLVQSTNAAELTLWPELLGTRLGASIVIVWNGEPYHVIYRGTSITLHALVHRPYSKQFIADAFAAPFLLVRGTGDGQHNAGIESFQAQWRRLFFSKCRTKTDSRVSLNDIKTYNLVVIGTIKSRCPLRRHVTEQLLWHEKENSEGWPNLFRDKTANYIVAMGGRRTAAPMTVLINADSSKIQQANFILHGLFPSRIWRLPAK